MHFKCLCRSHPVSVSSHFHGGSLLTRSSSICSEAVTVNFLSAAGTLLSVVFKPSLMMLMLFVNFIMGYAPYLMLDHPLVSKYVFLSWKCKAGFIMCVALFWIICTHTFTSFCSLPQQPAWLKVHRQQASRGPFCSHRKPLKLLMFLWMSCPMLKRMSSLHDCYWPPAIFISSLQIVECPILVPFLFSLVCLCCCWLYSQSLGLERAWLKWSQFHPIQYLHKLSPLLFFPPLSLYIWTFF